MPRSCVNQKYEKCGRTFPRTFTITWVTAEKVVPKQWASHQLRRPLRMADRPAFRVTSPSGLTNKATEESDKE